MAITSGKFEAELFAMTNGKNFQHNEAFAVPMTEQAEYDASAKKVSLTQTPLAGTVYINGLELTTDYTVAGKVITFQTGVIDAGTKKIKVSYEYAQEAEEANIDNRSSAMGEAVLKYPVYSSGDDCSDSGIIGHVLMRVYRARITQQPGLTKTSSFKQQCLSILP